MNIIPGRPRIPQFDWQPVPTEHQDLLQDRQLSQEEYDRLMSEATEHRLPVISPRITKQLDLAEVDTRGLPRYSTSTMTALLDQAPKPRNTSASLPRIGYVSPECSGQFVYSILHTFCQGYLTVHGALPQALRLSKDNYDVIAHLGYNWYCYEQTLPVIDLYHDEYVLPHLKCDEVRIAPKGNGRDAQEEQHITPKPKRRLQWTDLLGWIRRPLFRLSR